MSDYQISTDCLHAGYRPGNGEPRNFPIVQSTTFRLSLIHIWKKIRQKKVSVNCQNSSASGKLKVDTHKAGECLLFSYLLK